MYWILIALMVYMIFRTWFQVRRNGETQKVMKLMDHINEEEEFFALADQEIANQTSPEYQNKARVLKLFGDAMYRRKDEFMKDLTQLDMPALYMQKDKLNLDFNEDSFFYIYMAVPNKLYSVGDTDLINPLYEKLDEHEDVLNKMLVSKIGHEAKKFYLKEGDLGRTFFEALLEGDYAGYKYSPQLIGLYKQMVTALLARLALDEGNQEKYEEYVPDLKIFKGSSGLGVRWLRELNIELPEDPEEEEDTEAENAEEIPEENEAEVMPSETDEVMPSEESEEVLPEENVPKEEQE